MIRAGARSLALLVLLISAASAQSSLKKEDAEKMVIGLYAISVAVDTCDLDITKEQETRLKFRIEWADKQLNIADRKLDKAYDTMEKEAEKNKKDFCEKMLPIATQALKELPPSM